MNDDDFDLDLDSALDAWEADFGRDGTVTSESSPLPQTPADPKKSSPTPAPPAPAPATPTPIPPADTPVPPAPTKDAHTVDTVPPSAAPAKARPLYRPDPSFLEPLTNFADDFPAFGEDDFGTDESTRIASLSEELIASLEPVEAPQSTSQSAGDVELDLGDLFDEGDEEVTRIGALPSVDALRPPPRAADAMNQVDREIGDALGDSEDIDDLLDRLEMEIPESVEPADESAEEYEEPEVRHSTSPPPATSPFPTATPIPPSPLAARKRRREDEPTAAFETGRKTSRPDADADADARVVIPKSPPLTPKFAGPIPSLAEPSDADAPSGSTITAPPAAPPEPESAPPASAPPESAPPASAPPASAPPASSSATPAASAPPDTFSAGTAATDIPPTGGPSPRPAKPRPGSAGASPGTVRPPGDVGTTDVPEPASTSRLRASLALLRAKRAEKSGRPPPVMPPVEPTPHRPTSAYPLPPVSSETPDSRSALASPPASSALGASLDALVGAVAPPEPLASDSVAPSDEGASPRSPSASERSETQDAVTSPASAQPSPASAPPDPEPFRPASSAPPTAVEPPAPEPFPTAESAPPAAPVSSAPAESAPPAAPVSSAPAESAPPAAPVSSAPAGSAPPAAPVSSAPAESAPPAAPVSSAPAESAPPAAPVSSAPAESPTAAESTPPSASSGSAAPSAPPAASEPPVASVPAAAVGSSRPSAGPGGIGATLDALAPSVLPPPSDGGAATARRTVGHRKPRRESYAFVGRSADTLRNRAALLRKLAEGREGRSASRLLSAAAELEMQLGRAEEARELLDSAREADPSELATLRDARREAVSQGDWREVESLLVAEAELPLSDADHAGVHMLLAELRLGTLSDIGAAVTAAEAAIERDPNGAAYLLLAETLLADGRPDEAALALGSGRVALGADPLAALAGALAGRIHERAGRLDEARAAYSGDGLSARLGQARLATDAATRRDALLALAEGVDDALLRELAQRVASRSAVDAGDASTATATLAEARRPSSLRVRAHAADLAGETEARDDSLERLASVVGTTDRALALVALAEGRAAGGDLDGAEQCLRDAALADERLGTVQVVREVLARRAGDSGRLARAMHNAPDLERGAIEAAAKLALDPAASEAELEQLQRALDEGAAPRAADVLLLDAAAGLGESDRLLLALRRQADRCAPDERLGSLLALADRQNDPTDALTEAREVAPGIPAATRPLARVVRGRDPARAANAWLEEADGADRERAAHACTVAARIRMAAGDVEGAREAARAAMMTHSGPSPAAWLLEGDFGHGLEGDARADLLEDIAEGEGPESSLAEAHASAALAGRGGIGWQRALRRRPGDTLLRELVVSSPDVDAGHRATLLTEGVAGGTAADGAAIRLARIRAAAMAEDAREFAEAARLYRAVLDEGPDPIAARALDRVEIAGEAYARVAERRFAAVRAAEGTPRALAALEALVALDLHERKDATSAVLTLQSILQDAPGHVPTLRALERFYMDNRRDDSLADTSTAFAAHLADPRDVAAHGRLATRLLLAPSDAQGNAADGTLRRIATGALADAPVTPDRVWLAHRIRSATDDATIRARALRLIIDGSSDDERAALLAATTTELQTFESTEALADELTLAESAGHTRVAERLAWLHIDLGRGAEAARAFERAAEHSRDPNHQLALYDFAASCWEHVDDDVNAVRALERAAAIDVAHGDVFARLQARYRSRGESQKLAALAEARVAAGADQATLLSLHETQADLKSTLGDRAGAKEALRAALEIEPQRVDALERLAHVCLEDEDWRGAAEALIRFARLRQDREDLRWVFFTLGDIYDRHLPDFRRAEAAYSRVLKLLPEDLEARERLCRLFEREGEWAKAIAALRQLLDLEIDPDECRRHGIALARAHESAGDARSAEQTLEKMRRAGALELDVLRAMADLYERQGARAALSMHLGRAVGDYRRFVAESPAEAHGWSGLCEVLEWRGLQDASQVVASAAAAVGVLDLDLDRRVGPDGGAPGAGASAGDPALHELIAPPLLTPATFEVFREATEALEKLLPFDARQWRAERPTRDEDGLRREALSVAQWFGFTDVQILLTDAAPRICVPVSNSPLTLVCGRELCRTADEPSRAFLFARAAKIASVNLGVAMRSQPAQLGLVLASLVRTFDPHHQPAGMDPAELEDMTRRVARVLPRRVRDTLGAAVIEMGGTAGFDGAHIGLAAAQLGDRAALLGLGSAPAAIEGLLRLAASTIPERGRPEPRMAVIRALPEAADLLNFAISDAHFDARRRAGADRRP